MSTKRQPYVGPRPFEKEDREFFFGREPETIELSALIVADPVVLLYAQSGAGKTSLLNAGLIPKLEARGFEVFPPTRVSGAQPRGIDLRESDNIFVFNALTRWGSLRRASEQSAHLSLAGFLSEHPHLTDDEGLPTLRIIIFDQLEEIFTSYPESSGRRKDFFHQLGLALEGEPEGRSKGSAFEFSEAGAETRIKGDPLLRALLVIREDYLAQIEAYAPLLPDKLRTRFRLERLREEAALAAVTGPLQKIESGRRFAPGVAEKLVADLMKVSVETVAGKTEMVSGEFVEPVQLQVVCQRLLAALPDEVTEITGEHLAGFGDVSQALSSFYEDCLARAVRQTGVREWDLRTWFASTLITSAGTRGDAYRGARDTGGIPNATVDLLEDLHLIRGEQRAGARWYELTHDRMIEPIQESNRIWLDERREVEQMRQRLEEKTADWVRMGRRGGLLDEVELLEVERALEDPIAAELDLSPDQSALIEQSRAAIEEAKREKEVAARHELEQAARAAKYLRLLVAFLLIVMFVGVIFGIAWQNRERELEQERRFQLLLARSTSLWLEGDQTGLALLLAVEAYRKRPAFEALKVLLIGLNQGYSSTPFPTRIEAQVTSVAFSPDGKILASGSEDNSIILWDPITRQQRRTLSSHEASVSSVVFSPDGKTLASSSQDKQIILWDVDTGQRRRTLVGHKKPATSVAFSPDGKILASGSEDNSIILWDPATDQRHQTLTGHRKPVTSVAFSPDGKILASGSEGGSIICWDVVTGGRHGQPLAGHNNEVTSLVFSATGEMLAAGSTGGSIILWDAAGRRVGQPLTHSDTHDNKGISNKGISRGYLQANKDNKAKRGKKKKKPRQDVKADQAFKYGESDVPTRESNKVITISFRSDGTLAAGYSNGSFIVWETATGQQRDKLLTNYPSTFNSIAFNPADSNQCVSGGEDAKLILWTIPERNPLMNSLANPLTDYREGQVTGLAFHPNGHILMLGGWDEGVVEWDMDNPRPKDPLTKDSVYSLALSPDGGKLAWGIQEGAKLRNLTTGQEMALISKRSRVTSIAISPDGKMLALGLWNSSIILCDAADGREIDVLSRHSGVVNSVAFSTDGRTLASGSRDKTVIIWDVAAKQPRVAPLTSHGDRVSSVAFSPDGRILASGGQDKRIILWSTATGQQVGNYGSSVAVSSLVFSPNGEILASGGEAGNVTLWRVDMSMGSAVLQKLGGLHAEPERAVHSLAFSRDGKTLASGSGGNNSVTLWDVNFDSLIERACRIANRNLTDDEWKRFLDNEPYRKSCPNLP